MPLIKPTSNPIMNMQNEIQWIEKVQGLVGMLSMFLLMLIVRDDIKFFSISTTKEKTFFALTIGMILINFVGWTFYYLGYQYGWLIVISQFAVVPLYYLFFGLFYMIKKLLSLTFLFVFLKCFLCMFNKSIYKNCQNETVRTSRGRL